MATAIFALAILHTFAAPWFTGAGASGPARATPSGRALVGRPAAPSVLGEVLHFLGEVEVVFGLWALRAARRRSPRTPGWHTATGYFNGTVNYTEPLFVVVIMALASTRPIVLFAERALRVRRAAWAAGTPAAWWVTILTIGPLLGSFITEPAAMTICALLLARQFYDLRAVARA